VLQRADLSTVEGRAKAAEAAMALVAEHPNELVRDQYLMIVSDRTRLGPDALRGLTSSAGAKVGSAGEARNFQGAATKVRAARPQGGDTQRAGLEALRLLVHRPKDVAGRLVPLLFLDDVQRSVFELLSADANLRDAISSADETSPDVANLVRRLTVEDPSAEADDVIVQLVRFAARRALGDLDAQARLSPSSFARVAAQSAFVKKSVEELDQPELADLAVERLLAWLSERGEERHE